MIIHSPTAILLSIIIIVLILSITILLTLETVKCTLKRTCKKKKIELKKEDQIDAKMDE